MESFYIIRNTNNNQPLTFEGKVIHFYHEDEAVTFLTTQNLDDGSHYIDNYNKSQKYELIDCAALAARFYQNLN